MKLIKRIGYILVLIIGTPIWIQYRILGTAKSWNEFINGAKPHNHCFTKINKDKEYMSCNHFGCNLVKSKQLLNK